MPPCEAVGEGLPVGRHADHAHHRPQREGDAVVHVHGVALDAKDLRQRRLHLIDQLPDAGDERCKAAFLRPDLEQLHDQRVARLRPSDRDRPGRGVDPLEVDLRDEIGLALDLAREAVVRLEGHDRAGLDLEHGLQVGAERPDDLVTTDPMLRAGRHQWRKCLRPVKTIAAPTASTAVMVWSSRIEPPGWISALIPASRAICGPSANGKYASLASEAPAVS